MTELDTTKGLSMGDGRFEHRSPQSKSQDSSKSLEYFAGWDPPYLKPLVPPKNLEHLLSGNPNKPNLFGETNRLTNTDKPCEAPIQNGVMELCYNDPDFDRKLNSSSNYQVLKITGMPGDVKLRHWMDDNGYFFWFPQGSDHEARHHYPRNLRVIEIDGQREDVDLQRLKVSEAYMAKQLGTQSGFNNMDRRTNVMMYFRQMSQASQEVLKAEEKVLREGAQTSNNPYFRIYLSDVLVTQAMQPIIKSMLDGGQINLDNPETLKKLDEAIDELRRAQKTSYDELSKGNKFPPGNVTMPLSPSLYYYDPYAFWGGSLYQAQRREVALVMVRGLVKTGAFRNIELPPVMPPR